MISFMGTAYPHKDFWYTSQVLSLNRYECEKKVAVYNVDLTKILCSSAVVHTARCETKF